MLIHEELSHEVVGAGMTVHRILGSGLLENAYEQAMVIELEDRGIRVERQKEFRLVYKGREAGIYFADLVVEGKIILELKAVTLITKVMEAQLMNYMRLAGIGVGYVMNFRNERLEWKRRVTVATRSRVTGHNLVSDAKSDSGTR